MREKTQRNQDGERLDAPQVLRARPIAAARPSQDPVPEVLLPGGGDEGRGDVPLAYPAAEVVRGHLPGRQRQARGVGVVDVPRAAGEVGVRVLLAAARAGHDGGVGVPSTSFPGRWSSMTPTSAAAAACAAGGPTRPRSSSPRRARTMGGWRYAQPWTAPAPATRSSQSGTSARPPTSAPTAGPARRAA